MSQNKVTNQVSSKYLKAFAAKFVLLWNVGLILKRVSQTNDTNFVDIFLERL